MALVRVKLNLEEVNEELSEQLDKAGIMKPSTRFGFEKNRTEEMLKKVQLQLKEK